MPTALRLPSGVVSKPRWNFTPAIRRREKRKNSKFIIPVLPHVLSYGVNILMGWFYQEVFAHHLKDLTGTAGSKCYLAGLPLPAHPRRGTPPLQQFTLKDKGFSPKNLRFLFCHHGRYDKN
jgi:hypothetical protein